MSYSEVGLKALCPTVQSLEESLNTNRLSCLDPDLLMSPEQLLCCMLWSRSDGGWKIGQGGQQMTRKRSGSDCADLVGPMGWAS